MDRARLTVPVNPPIGVRVIVDDAVALTTVLMLVWPAVILKSGMLTSTVDV